MPTKHSVAQSSSGNISLCTLHVDRFQDGGGCEPSEEVRWEQVQILEVITASYPAHVRVHRQQMLGTLNCGLCVIMKKFSLNFYDLYNKTN
jgi:hypothetical protein